MPSVTVHIGDTQRALADADPQWINEQIGARRRAGEQVCVRVKLRAPNVDLVFATAGCDRSAGSPRRFMEDEQRLIAHWRRIGLDDDDFSGGQLFAFLQQLR